MKNKKRYLYFLPFLLVLAALYPALTRHPLSFFVLKGEESQVEAFRLSAPLNERDVTVESLSLSPSQKKEGGEILAQKDVQQLAAFSKNFGTYPGVIGVPVTQEGWPGFLGGGLKGIWADNTPGGFDNLQWTDRVYLALFTKVPPPAPFTPERGLEIVLPATTSVVSPVHPSSTPNPATTPGVLRVEILNGCG